VIDEHGRTEYLSVMAAHRPDCAFGSGFFRLTFNPGQHEVRYCQTWDDVLRATRLLEGVVGEIRIERDGHCLDGDSLIGDARTPDVVDGDWWLSLSREDAMRELGLTSEADYKRAYDAIAATVYRRDNRASQGGVRASIIIKRPGARVVNA
jgi:hypothetical protein